MNVTGLILLLLAHFLTGRGIISIFRIKEKPLPLICLSLIIGTVCFSMLPMILEMCHVPITATSVAVAILILIAGTFGLRSYKLDYSIFKKVPPFRLRLYELIFIGLFIALMIPSVWRCFYLPPAARDVLSGPEPLAEYTVREHTMINSVLTLDLWGTNNHLKPPYVLGLQVVYKLFVHPFGQLWLSVMVLSFLTWLYCLLRDRVHPFIAGIVLLYFISMPDPYGYTYIILFDYSNMIVFFAAVYYLSAYLIGKDVATFYFSVFLFGLATFIRLETLVLIGMLVPLVLFTMYRDKVRMQRIILNLAVFLIVPACFYYVWTGVFLKYYMPGGFDLGTQVNTDWSNVEPFFDRWGQMNKTLLFSKISQFIYGYIHIFFLLVLIADCIFFRRFNKEARIMLYAIAVVYIGMPLLGYITPLFDLLNTTKRGLYKMFPLMVLYMANSALFARLSQGLSAFEKPTIQEAQPVQPVRAVNQTAPRVKKGVGKHKR